jgi:DNA-binding beta-propeller fold protein YncE
MTPAAPGPRANIVPVRSHSGSVDTAGSLYAAHGCYDQSDVEKRDAQGNWSVIARVGTDVGQVYGPSGLAVDTAGRLYVAHTGKKRVQMYTPPPGP